MEFQVSEEISLEEFMQLSEEDRRHILMSSFGSQFSQVHNLIVKLSILPPSSLTEEETPILVQALYLASIEYTRYCENLIPEGEPIH